MVERFLRYSYEHACPIRVLLLDTMKYRNILVTGLQDGKVYYLDMRKKQNAVMDADNILSAAYARGDDGDTLQYANIEAVRALAGVEKEKQDLRGEKQ